MASTKDVGAIGESVAAEFLRRKGYKVIERNYRKPWGEIDIIAEKGNIVRFIEVKSVSRESIGDITKESDDHRPEEMVHQYKLQKIARTAEMYMNHKNDTRDFQIDVVGVFLNMQSRSAKCRLFEQVL
jgi:putative endonuclease